MKRKRGQRSDIRQWLQTSLPGKSLISLRSMVSFGSLHDINDLGRDFRLLPRWPSQTTITWQETVVVVRQMVRYLVQFYILISTEHSAHNTHFMTDRPHLSLLFDPSFLLGQLGQTVQILLSAR